MWCVLFFSDHRQIILFRKVDIISHVAFRRKQGANEIVGILVRSSKEVENVTDEAGAYSVQCGNGTPEK